MAIDLVLIRAFSHLNKSFVTIAGYGKNTAIFNRTIVMKKMKIMVVVNNCSCNCWIKLWARVWFPLVLLRGNVGINANMAP